MGVHVLAGYLHRGRWTRAVCRCGQPGPARESRQRAGIALDRVHRLDPLTCGWCERTRAPQSPPRRPVDVGLAIGPAGTGPWPDLEYLACTEDLAACAQLSAQLARRYEASAAEADAYLHRLTRPRLRLIR